MGNIVISDTLAHVLHRSPAVVHLRYERLKDGCIVKRIILCDNHFIGTDRRILQKLRASGDRSAHLIVCFLCLRGTEVNGQRDSLHRVICIGVDSEGF